jgi:hypothetical protein
MFWTRVGCFQHGGQGAGSNMCRHKNFKGSDSSERTNAGCIYVCSSLVPRRFGLFTSLSARGKARQGEKWKIRREASVFCKCSVLFILLGVTIARKVLLWIHREILKCYPGSRGSLRGEIFPRKEPLEPGY